MSTLYKIEYENRRFKRIIKEINEENSWVFIEQNVKATRKYDGTACMVKDGKLYKRYDAKKGRTPPEGAIPCCDADPVTGHHPHWVLCEINNPCDKYHFKAFIPDYYEDGTYELIGEKIQGNPEMVKGFELIKHGVDILNIPDWNFDGFKDYLSRHNIEGIVFHGKEGKMCKLRKSDYGMKRKL